MPVSMGLAHGVLAIERDRHTGQRLGLAVAAAHHGVGGNHVADYGGRPDILTGIVYS